MDRITQGFREIAEEAEIQGRDDPQADIPELVRRWLRKARQSWLLVLDNLDDDALLTLRQEGESTSTSDARQQRPRRLSEYIPQVPNGALLITTRTMVVANELVEPRDSIQVGPMTHGEAVALLARKLDDNRKSEELDELASILEFMPLAMIQAAAYIQTRIPRCSVREYVDEFNRNDRSKTGLLSYEAGHLRRDHEARNSIINSWQISFEYIRQRWPSSANLLALMSFFDRQGIPEYVLTAKVKIRQYPDHEADTDISKTFHTDIERLREYSLVTVEVESHTFAMHRLVQLATQDWMTQHKQDRKQRALFLEKLQNSIPAVEQENWPTYEKLLPHVVKAEAVQPDCNDHDNSLYYWGLIMYSAAWWAWVRGCYDDSERMSSKSVRAFEQSYPDNKIGVTRGWSLLAQIYCGRGRYPLAEELSLRCLKVQRQVLGNDHLDTLITLSNLSNIYRRQGKWHEAE